MKPRSPPRLTLLFWRGTLPFGSLVNTIANANPAEVPLLLDQLSPETFQYARFVAFENSSFLAERMNSVCADLRGGYAGLDTSAISVVSPGFNSGLGRSLEGLFSPPITPAYHPSAPNGVNYYPGGGGREEGASPSSSSSNSTQTWDSSASQVISDSPNPYMTSQNPSGPETPGLSEFIGGDAVLANLNRDDNAAYAPPSRGELRLRRMRSRASAFG